VAPEADLLAGAWTEAAGENPTGEPLSEGEIVVRERAEAVRLGVAALSPPLRVIAVLFEFEAIPQAEIAVIIGCTPKAVENAAVPRADRVASRPGQRRLTAGP